MSIDSKKVKYFYYSGSVGSANSISFKADLIKSNINQVFIVSNKKF